MSTPYLVAYYGDDFTGSTDVMEALTLNGVPTALFLDAPPLERLKGCFPHIRAFGIAGMTRTLPPSGVEATLTRQLKGCLGIPHSLFHYKICSTFDSSPQTGSIGRALDTGASLTGTSLIPIMVGAPRLKRYVVFGQLFATVGATTFRIDRHPTMSRHPVTPMREADLRLHLQEQTQVHLHLADVLTLAGKEESLQQWLDNLPHSDEPAGLVLDTLTDEHLGRVGRWLWHNRKALGSFVIGSSGVEWALAEAWREEGLIPSEPPSFLAEEVPNLLVLAGSASPVTAAQIEHALGHGYLGLRMDVPLLLHPDSQRTASADLLTAAADALARGASVILYSALGPDDPAIDRTKNFLSRLETESAGHSVAKLQAGLLRDLIGQIKPPRLCIAGGDTSGEAGNALDIEALELAAPLAPGAPLCRVHHRNSGLLTWQVVFKGGQNGGLDFFESVRRARRE